MENVCWKPFIISFYIRQEHWRKMRKEATYFTTIKAPEKSVENTLVSAKKLAPRQVTRCLQIVCRPRPYKCRVALHCSSLVANSGCLYEHCIHIQYLSAKHTCNSWCCSCVRVCVSDNVENDGDWSEWPSDQVTKWPSDEWPSDEWPSDQVTEWLSDWVNEWTSDRVTEWPSDQVTKWPSDQVT